MKSKTTNPKRPYILIVEDENLFYLDMSAYLKEKGFDVAPYTKSYSEAIQSFHERLPDAVLMDVDLNGELNGINVAQRIREFSDVPIIFLSNLPTSDNLLEAGKANADDFLVKTALRNNDQIYATLQLVLHKKRKTHPKYGIRVLSKYKIENPNTKPKNLSDTQLDNTEKQNITSANEKSIILPFRDIAYITAVNDFTPKMVNGQEVPHQVGKGYQAFHCTNGKIYYRHNPLRELKEDKLPEYFLFPNQSYLVNAYKVSEILNRSTILVHNTSIQVNQNFRDEFFKNLSKFCSY